MVAGAWAVNFDAPATMKFAAHSVSKYQTIDKIGEIALSPYKTQKTYLMDPNKVFANGHSTITCFDLFLLCSTLF